MHDALDVFTGATEMNIKEKYHLKLIKRFPKCHDRNVEITIKSLKENSCRKVANEYNLSHFRVSEICRILGAHLAMQVFKIPLREAVNNKKYYRHPEMLNIVKEYKNMFAKE